jgi:peptidoglycan/LPS O-acetylase OafA/YrhL
VARARVRLSEVAGSRGNNFDVLRLSAAGLVLVSHSFPLTGRREPLAPHTLGTVGVEIFFAISGFLVTKSWLGDPSWRRYLVKRARRIFPGLIGAVLVTALVVGPVFSSISPTAFLTSGAPVSYTISNMLLLPHWVLETVFSSNPDHAANGSLWTLPVEMRAYILLAIFGTGLLARRTVIGITAAVVFGLNIGGSLSPSMQLMSLFAAGSLLYLLRGSVVLRFDIAAGMLALWLAAFTTPFATAAGMLALPYLIACVAYCTPSALRRLVAKGDVSYGVYLYAFPIQQSIVSILGPIPPLGLATLAAPLAWLAGLASWRIVERPILYRRKTAHARAANAPGVIVAPPVV